MRHIHTLDLRTVPGPAPGDGGVQPGGAWPVEIDIAAAANDATEFLESTTHTLPEGLRLLDYEIVGPIGEGGFGVVYLAWDHAREQHVAIKEYLPAVLASRARASPAVVVRSQRHGDSYRIGLRSFVHEARMLARFDHPALVKVLQFWEDNGTAYMAMPYYEGPTLAQALARLGRAPAESELLGWLRPLLDALGTLHALGCCHRDVAPDNILLTDHGPVLLDFGAARRVIDGLAAAPTVVFKPGFAPIEQYGDMGDLKQGAWTDLYALAAVVYTAITGEPPMPSIQRLVDDRLRPLSACANGRYSPHFLAAVDAALALQPQNRPQSAAEFWLRLIAPVEMPVDAPGSPSLDTDVAAPARTSTRRPVGARAKAAWFVAAAALAVVAVVGHWRGGDPVVVAPQSVSASAPVAVSVPVPAPAPAHVPAVRAPIPEPVATPAAVVVPPPLDTAPVVLPEPPAAPTAVVPSPPSEPAAPAAPPILQRAEAAPIPTVAPRQAPTRKPKPAVVATAAPRPAPTIARPAAPRRDTVGSIVVEGSASRCAELLQRASLQPLSPGETALLRKGCAP